MIDDFTAVFKILNPRIVIFSILLFFLGYAFAPTAYFKKITWLTAYPFFIIKLLDKYFKKDWHPLKIFVVIFSLNSFSLFLNLLSGWGIVLPVLFMIYMGINIGVVMYHSLDGHFYYLSLLNPVAVLELPAAWITITMAIQFSLSNYLGFTDIGRIEFAQYIYYFVVTILPVLGLAGIIETVLLLIARKNEDNQNNSEDNQNNDKQV